MESGDFGIARGELLSPFFLRGPQGGLQSFFFMMTTALESGLRSLKARQHVLVFRLSRRQISLQCGDQRFPLLELLRHQFLDAFKFLLHVLNDVLQRSGFERRLMNEFTAARLMSDRLSADLFFETFDLLRFFLKGFASCLDDAVAFGGQRSDAGFPAYALIAQPHFHGGFIRPFLLDGFVDLGLAFRFLVF